MISDEQGQEAASKWNLSYHTTSAKSGENVNALFTAIADRLPDMKESGAMTAQHPSTIKIEKEVSARVAQDRQSGCSC